MATNRNITSWPCIKLTAVFKKDKYKEQGVALLAGSRALRHEAVVLMGNAVFILQSTPTFVHRGFAD